MYILSLKKRLLPAAKAWKNFTSKLQTKLHKLRRSNGFKKSITSHQTKILRPSLSAQLPPKRKKTRRFTKPSRYRCYLLGRKRPVPIFIDELSEVVKDFRPQPNIKLVHHSADMPRTCVEDVKGNEKMFKDDDMWESLGLASPQMQGIDDRAEEFIARFRAEMKSQESMEHGL